MDNSSSHLHDLHCNNCFNFKKCPYYLNTSTHPPGPNSGSFICPIIRCKFYPACQFEMHHCKCREHYTSTCQETEISCINAHYGCPMRLKRKYVAEHLKVCPASVVHCSFKWVRKLLPQYTMLYQVSRGARTTCLPTSYTAGTNLANYSNHATNTSLDVTNNKSYSHGPTYKDDCFKPISCVYCRGPGSKPCQLEAISNNVDQDLLDTVPTISDFSNKLIKLGPLRYLKDTGCMQKNMPAPIYDYLNIDKALLFRDQMTYFKNHPAFVIRIFERHGDIQKNVGEVGKFDFHKNMRSRHNPDYFNNKRRGYAKSNGGKHARSFSFYDFVMIKRAEEVTKLSLANSRIVANRHHRGLSLKACCNGGMENYNKQDYRPSEITLDTSLNRYTTNTIAANTVQLPRPKSYPQVIPGQAFQESSIEVSLNDSISSAASTTRTSQYRLLPVRVIDKILKCRTFVQNTLLKGLIVANKSVPEKNQLLSANTASCNPIVPTCLPINKESVTSFVTFKSTENGLRDGKLLNLDCINKTITRPTASSSPPYQEPINTSSLLEIDKDIRLNNIQKCSKNYAKIDDDKIDDKIKNGPPIQFYDKRFHSFARYYFDPESVHYFTCGEFMRRDTFSWHYLNVHAQIECHLDEWLVHRCPLAALSSSYSQSKCNFSVPRWIPLFSKFTPPEIDLNLNSQTSAECKALDAHKLEGTLVYHTNVNSLAFKLSENVQTNNSQQLRDKGLNLLSLPPDALNNILAHLEPLDLINVACTNKYLNTFTKTCPSFKSKAMVLCIWEKIQTHPATRWKIAKMKWVFPKSFTPIRDWKMNESTSGIISEHLKECPLNEVIRKQEPFKLPLPPFTQTTNEQSSSTSAMVRRYFRNRHKHKHLV